MNRILRIVRPEAMGRATGAFRSSFLVGIGAGPALGGVVAEGLGLAAPFHIYATVLLVSAAIAWFAMAGAGELSSTRKRSPLEALGAAGPLFRDIRYVVALLATFVGWWSIAGPAQTVGVVFAQERLGFSTGRIGLAITLLSAGELLALVISGRAADRFGRRAVLVPSLAVMAAALAALGHIEGAPPAFFPILVVVGASVAATGTASGGLLADAIPRGGSGAAVGVNQMAGDLGYLLSPTVVGAAAERAGFGFAYIVGAIPAALVFLASLRLPAGAPPRPHEVAVEPAEPVG
jgi:predicted MFS family arabinose efflux permease